MLEFQRQKTTERCILRRLMTSSLFPHKGISNWNHISLVNPFIFQTNRHITCHLSELLEAVIHSSVSTKTHYTVWKPGHCDQLQQTRSWSQGRIRAAAGDRGHAQTAHSIFCPLEPSQGPSLLFQLPLAQCRESWHWSLHTPPAPPLLFP